MIVCSNCSATDHEPNARFCHVCGLELTNNLVNRRENSENPQSQNDQNNSYNIPEAIDLNLPSGTKWASFNVGATKPEECGSYFAWGETEEKTDYSWRSYDFCDNDSGYDCVHLGRDICGTQYDVAYVKLGRQWRMPSFDQFMELIRNCEFEFTTLNGVLGGKFTSKINGNSIFFPTTGMYKDHQIQFRDNAGYWSGTHEPVGYDEYLAYSFGFISGWVSTGTHERNIGLPVRPIMMGNSSKIQASGEKTIGENLLSRWWWKIRK